MNYDFHPTHEVFIQCGIGIYERATIISVTPTTFTTDYIVDGSHLKFSKKTLRVTPKDDSGHVAHAYTDELNKLCKLENISRYLRPNTWANEYNWDKQFIDRVIALAERFIPNKM